jgi:hypothetical protein
MTAHSNINAIHISQVPEQWEGKSTYTNDLIYNIKPMMMTSQDCRDYLGRKIKQLQGKLSIEGAAPGHQRRWRNQLEVYEAILKYLSLHKL